MSQFAQGEGMENTQDAHEEIAPALDGLVDLEDIDALADATRVGNEQGNAMLPVPTNEEPSVTNQARGYKSIYPKKYV